LSTKLSENIIQKLLTVHKNRFR